MLIEPKRHQLLLTSTVIVTTIYGIIGVLYLNVYLDMVLLFVLPIIFYQRFLNKTNYKKTVN